jgi:lipoprotein-releasing system permease protein
VISIISVFGVAFGTMTLVVVLSVFNGLEDLIRSLYSTFDPQIKISVVKGKAFQADEAFLKKVKSVDGVDLVTEVIEDWAHLTYRGDEKLVKVKGVSSNFIQQQRMDSMIVEGNFKLRNGEQMFAIVGRGIQAQLMISLNDELGFLTLRYPVLKDKSHPNTDDPTKYYDNQKVIKPGAIFAIEKQYDDNYIFVPLEFAEELMDYGTKRTSLEIKTKPGFEVDDVRDNLRELLGPSFQVLNSDEQHSSLLKAIKVEKLFMYITFSIILGIASLNILFSLTMLAIEKKKDVAILFSIGASRKFIRKVFLNIGVLIAVIGAAVGLILGFLTCFIQQQFGLVSMGMETSIVEAYPVKMQLSDFVFAAITIFIITFAISYRPASAASRFDIRENLK